MQINNDLINLQHININCFRREITEIAENLIKRDKVEFNIKVKVKWKRATVGHQDMDLNKMIQ